LDFPFGPPAAVRDAMKWANWRHYLKWCKDADDLETYWERIPEGLRRNRRDIDTERCTTWRPFQRWHYFYRQTMAGARDVLFPMAPLELGSVSILPFDVLSGQDGTTVGECVEQDCGLSVAMEGFPGYTLRTRGLPDKGYKKSKSRPSGDEVKRNHIVESLRDHGMPISDEDASRAVQNVEGDAVDALVLLDAAKRASGRNLEDWRDRVGPNADIEGWFFD
ncbi:MAG: hypothetical protein OXE50_04850, partial [Chloroflexi bacterium]|nr:hypothetical protein [Chloroflexota bacterium]